MDWNKERKILGLAQHQFYVFVTVDQDLPYQQELSKFSMAIIALKAGSNHYKDLIHFVEPASKIIKSAKAGRLYEITRDTS